VAVTIWLIDKSAYVRLPSGVHQQEWANRVERGLVRVSTVTRLELGFSYRNIDNAQYEVANPPLVSMPLEYINPAIEHRAVEVQMMLTQRGQHRAASVADLLVAATAEINGLTVLHFDKDFDLIASITGQPVETFM